MRRRDRAALFVPADAIVEREERLVHAASGAAEVAHHALCEDFALARVVRVGPLRLVRLPDGLAVIVVLGRACRQRDACSRTNTKGGGGRGTSSMVLSETGDAT